MPASQVAAQVDNAHGTVSVHTHGTASKCAVPRRTSASTTDGEDSCPKEVTWISVKTTVSGVADCHLHAGKQGCGRRSKPVPALTMLCNSVAERS